MKRLSERMCEARTDTRSETRSGSEREIGKSSGGERKREDWNAVDAQAL